MLTKTDTSNTALSEFEFQVKQIQVQIQVQLREAKYLYNQRKLRVSSCLDSWMRNKGIGTDIPNLLKLEKILWEKLNIGTSMNVILQQIDKFYEEISK